MEALLLKYSLRQKRPRGARGLDATNYCCPRRHKLLYLSPTLDGQVLLGNGGWMMWGMVAGVFNILYQASMDPNSG